MNTNSSNDNKDDNQKDLESFCEEDFHLEHDADAEDDLWDNGRNSNNGDYDPEAPPMTKTGRRGGGMNVTKTSNNRKRKTGKEQSTTSSYASSGKNNPSSDHSGHDFSGRDLSGRSGADDTTHRDIQEEDRAEVQALVAKETRAWWVWRAVLVVVFLGCPIVVALGVYRYLKNEQDEEFAARIVVTADQVYERMAQNLQQLLEQADQVAWTRWDLAVQKQEDLGTFDASQWFPYSSRPHWARAGERLISQMGAQQFVESLIVTQEQQPAWQEYAASHNGWVADVIQKSHDDGNQQQEHSYTNNISYPQLPLVDREKAEQFLVGWQTFPVLPTTLPVYNSDYLVSTDNNDVYETELKKLVLEKKNVAFSKFQSKNTKALNKGIYFTLHMPLMDRTGSPDLFNDPNALKQADILGLHTYEIDLQAFLTRLLPEDTVLNKLDSIYLVASNTCGQRHTYFINDSKKAGSERISYVDLGPDDDGTSNEYHYMKVVRTLKELVQQKPDPQPQYQMPPQYPPVDTNSYCPITFEVVPTQDTKNQYLDSEPIIFATCAVAVYIFTSVLLIVYDLIVSRRQSIVMKAAVQSSGIVSSLFPPQVRDRLFGNRVLGQDEGNKKNKSNTFRVRRGSTGENTDHSNNGSVSFNPGSVVTGYSSSTANPLGHRQTSPPVADLYPEATVMFADIAGFTAWCSAREPSQVFVLLETLYGAFDSHAKARSVFKVETIGDSYVAVCGLPEPNPNHAMLMSRFARECLDSMSLVCNHLMVELGPDTADLSLRVGLHSGAVTAGVLRGQKARFQLFGDTVNTAARMESNGLPGCIQASEATFKALEAQGKGHWARKREELIEAKGKGKMQTYWVDPKMSDASTIESASSLESEGISGVPRIEDWRLAAKMEGLLAWNVDILSRLLQRIAASRAQNRRASMGRRTSIPTLSDKVILFERSQEIAFVFSNPKPENESVPLSDTLVQKIREFVLEIGGLYNDGLPYHNFERATHVTLSLKTMIISAEKTLGTKPRDVLFSSDPVAEFGCLFAMLIHGVDHTGASNRELVQETNERASLYQGRCINEQHAFNVGMDLLASEKYNEIRVMIASTKEEWARFRQVVVNCILATDTTDKDFGEERLDQWEKCFGNKAQNSAMGESMGESFKNQKTTIFMEYIVQAAVTGPSMQHHQVFIKWFRRSVLEAHQISEIGDPTNKSRNEVDWYQDEMDHFDKFVLPLATRLDKSGLLAGIGREHLEYATQNRTEFAEKGQQFLNKLQGRIAHNDKPALLYETILEEETEEDAAVEFSEALSESLFCESAMSTL